MIKRVASQACDSCCREFTPKRVMLSSGSLIDWSCPYCGFDNCTGREFAKHGQQVALTKSLLKAASLKRSGKSE